MSNLTDCIANDLMEKVAQTYGRVGRRFNINRVGELRHDWFAATPCSVPSCDIGVAFTHPADAMREVARLYREALLADADVQFEVWVEKDAADDYAPRIAGLYACRGFGTLAFLQSWSGVIYDNAYDAWTDDRIAETLAELADEPILAQRLAVMPEQIAVWPARLDRYRDYEFISEYPLDNLGQIVRQAMEDHLPREEFKIMKLAEESDRQTRLEWKPWEW